MTIDKRKAELREYIAIMNNALDDGESARIAEQLLECIEALEYYGSRPSSVNIQGITIELAEGKETVGYKARRLLEKIAGEK